jgi:hypothetical protein
MEYMDKNIECQSRVRTRYIKYGRDHNSAIIAGWDRNNKL